MNKMLFYRALFSTLVRPTQSIPASSNPEIVTPEDLRPFPKAAPRKMNRRGRQPGRTKILTMTPEK